jgi:PilZ domain
LYKTLTLEIQVAGTVDPERRQHKRIPFIKDVKMVGVGTLQCLNLSIEGLYLETTIPLPEGTVVGLRFKLCGEDEAPIDVQARVLYTYEGVGVGLGFFSLNAEDRKKIVKFIEQG